ncbi:hypothetical protein ACFY8K_36975 [Streptomyces misionensis]
MITDEVQQILNGELNISADGTKEGEESIADYGVLNESGSGSGTYT